MSMTKEANLPSFPRLPLICLDDSAEELTTHDVVQGRNTVIDFWTTRCTRCPSALDELDARNSLDNVQRVSICCDKLDGARQILDQPDGERRWPNLQHYFMSKENKERAKKVLGFASVPFYVVLNEHGEIVQLGHNIDWDSIPGSCDNNKENEDSVQVPGQEDPEFVLNDLDF